MMKFIYDTLALVMYLLGKSSGYHPSQLTFNLCRRFYFTQSPFCFLLAAHLLVNYQFAQSQASLT